LWLEEALADPDPVIDPLGPQIAIESHALPNAFHRDPADRLIVATARVTNATLMTRDRRILDYAARGHLSAIAPEVLLARRPEKTDSLVSTVEVSF
jgi:PIN domain nuclease of toxin-antitoxin system